ncbi:NAD-glutamate dehydrogenase domain-containing protein [Saccharopolyspora sp. NPDC002686]|uniref:NAD-glutamate dehydrogenase domain-containing protein n=1 Tax=Saccharopolyspora sp. NPDC002686 TaxID=3154541 RepID=UPI003324308D
MEFARAGGKVNTDALDNSAGVDCSDHEVMRPRGGRRRVFHRLHGRVMPWPGAATIDRYSGSLCSPRAR